MTYNSYLTTNREKLMTTKDLGNVLNLGKNSTNTTKNILMKYKMINLKCDDTFKVNTKYCSKGASLRPNTNKIRIFTKPLKELYKKANPREHVQLDLLYRMIPYLHFSTNICCKNPYEIDIDKIEPYSLKELASLIHETNTTRFKRKLLDTTVSNEHVLQVLRFNSKQAIAVNPRICFKGNYNDAIALADYGIHFK
jgi:hypothetical protein